jgi:hypothetical protein
VALFPLFKQRTAVVGNGNLDVGNATPTRKTGQRIDPSSNSPGICGAMSQQGGEFRGNVSAPQKFVQLVGCRDRKAASAEVHQYSNPVKR